MLLPFMDQVNIYNSLNPNVKLMGDWANDPVNYTLLQISIPAFLCPSDIGGNLNQNRSFNGSIGAPTHYMTTAINPLLAANANYAACGGNTGSNDGIFGNGVSPFVTFANITDGASNTIALGERSTATWPKTPPNAGPPMAALLYGDEVSSTQTGDSAVTGQTQYQMNSGLWSAGPGVSSYADSPTNAFGSIHAGGAHFLLADGRVRFISDTVQFVKATGNNGAPTGAGAGIYQLLGSMNDGQPIGQF